VQYDPRKRVFVGERLEKRLQEMKHEEGFLEGSKGSKLYYQKWLPSGSPDSILVFVHGLGDHSGRHENLVEAVVTESKALYAFDLRGHGRSSGQRGHIDSWDDFREDVAAFLHLVREEQPDKPVFLMGHSLGGIIVLEFVLRQPPGLTGVIASSAAIGEASIPPWKMALARFISRVWPNFTMKQSWDQEISRDRKVVEESKADPLTHSYGSVRLASEYTDVLDWTRSHAGQLELPLLLLHGKADAVVPPRSSRSFLQEAGSRDKTLKEYDGALHELDNDVGHEKVLDDLLEWIDQHSH
jgi:alpha-beta hydrolase superfamily lysophospholipase